MKTNLRFWSILSILALAGAGCARMFGGASSGASHTTPKSSNPVAFKKAVAYKKQVPPSANISVRNLVEMPDFDKMVNYSPSSAYWSAIRSPAPVISMPVVRYDPVTFPPLPVAPPPTFNLPGSLYTSPTFNTQGNLYASPGYNLPGSLYTSPGYNPGTIYSSPGYTMPGSLYTSPGYNLPGSFYSSPMYNPPTFYNPPAFYNPPTIYNPPTFP